MSQTLEIARSALLTTRTAMELTAQNVANAQTPGYLRQRVSLAPVSLADTTGVGKIGNGVTVQAIERLRNQCLEAQINHQEGLLGQEQARYESLSRVETAFCDLSGTGLSQALGAFFEALEKLQTTPESTVARGEVTYAADTFARETRTLSAQISQEGALLDTELTQKVAGTNALLHEVAALNAKIMSLGDNPQSNDLKVSREQAIRKLASLCGASGLDQPNHAQDVLLGGIRLVQGSEVTELSLTADPTDPARQVLVAGTVQVDAPGGKIAGLLQARGEYLADWQQGLNDLVAGFAEAVNAQHRAGIDRHGTAGGDVFVYDPAAAAGSLWVSASLHSDPSLLAVGTAGGAPGDGGNALKLLNLRQTNLLSGGTQTAEQAYEELLYAVGVHTQRARDTAEARTGMVTALDTQYTNESGVSLDEEGVEIMRFQQVFSAATRLIKIADEMMQEILGLVN